MRRFLLAAVEFRRRIVWAAVILSVLAVAGVCLYLANREQPYDPDFDTRVADPAYQKDRPRVLFDEAHRNCHTTRTAYKPFADLMANDGYDVRPNRELFTGEHLAGVSVLIIVLARGSNEAQDEPAFSEAETDAVEQWIRSGGALLLITDHFPFGAAAEALGRRFGVHISTGLVEDPKDHHPSLGDSHLIFSRENGLLRDHPITRGRNAAEQVERVLTFTGNSLKGPAEAIAFMNLSDTAVDRPAR